MTRVLYTGAFRFPDQDAAAFRVQAVAALFERAGCEVTVAGWEAPMEGQAHYRHDGRDCHPQGEFRDRARHPLGRLLGFLTRGSRTIGWLRRNRRFDMVVAYNPPAFFALALLALGKCWRLPVVLDNTEWYESDHLPGGRFGPAAIENWLRMQVIYPRFEHIVCISRFLEHRYAGRNVIRIPALWTGPIDEVERTAPAACIRFVYAGDAGRKDRLIPFIRALPTIRDAVGREVALRVAGQDWPAMARILRDDGLDPAQFQGLVECHGRVSRARVAELYRDSHFSILFREDKRYARAGFPTKAVESWALGCPLLTNRVGDIGDLAEHLTDAIVVDEAAIATDVARALRGVLESGAYPAMSRNSRRKAMRLFTLSPYTSAFALFVQRIALPRSGPQTT